MGIQPSDTVTGPDAYGDAATPGTSDEYSRGDHNHGLPAASGGSLTVYRGTIGVDITLGTTPVTITGVALPGPAAYLISAHFLILTTAVTDVEAYIQVGSSQAGLSGQWATRLSNQQAASAYFEIGLNAYLDQAAAANVNFYAKCTNGHASVQHKSGIFTQGGASGYVITKVG